MVSDSWKLSDAEIFEAGKYKAGTPTFERTGRNVADAAAKHLAERVLKATRGCAYSHRAYPEQQKGILAALTYIEGRFKQEGIL